MKFIALAAGAIALAGLATPAEAAGNGAGYGLGTQRYYGYQQYYGYQRHYGYPGFILRFGLPHGAYGRYGFGARPFHAGPVLPARQVIRILRRCEYRHVRRLRLFDGVYRAQARDRRGRRVNLVIDAYTGVVIAARYAY